MLVQVKLQSGKKLILLLCGWICLALGAAGVVLPLLPTTPFVLLAAWCFSQGSERLHDALLRSKLFGPTIKNWQAHHAISLRAKAISTAVMVPLFTYTLLFVDVNLAVKLIVLSTCLYGLYFIWSKPLPPY